ncbi:DsbA family protein [Ectothiorhodospiraceae bacterium WFHF3C12]|nr:DsbA family protein [Ectothiorhodospiraceae bacterium WFHF3C12]
MGEAKRRKAQGEPPKSSRRRLRRRLLGGTVTAVVVAVLIGLYYVLTTPGVAPVDDLPTAAADAPLFPATLDRFGVSIGDADAPVTVREFADYQCPACARLAPIMERFREEYVETGKVRFVFFDFPLEQHDNAVPAAMAARCAGDQDAYWAMHERLYDAQSTWAETNDPMTRFADYAAALDLDTDMFNRCMLSGRHREAVTNSREAGARMRVPRTPTIYVDNIRLTQPGWYQLSGVVERELGKARTAEASE